MKALLLLYLLHLLGRRGSSACPEPCVCIGTVVDCSGRALTSSSLPRSFPADTTAIYLHENRLGSLPSGLLDRLPSLRRVSLHGNPWSCDCGVLYLRAWLLREPAAAEGGRATHAGVNCSSPAELAGRQVALLAEEEVLDTCHYWYCDLAAASLVGLFVFVALQAVLLAAVAVFLGRFERLSKEARRTVEDSLAPGENEYTAVRDTSI